MVNEYPTIDVSCAFAPDSQTQLYQSFSVAQGTTVRQAIAQLNWEVCQQVLADERQAEYKVGIFSQKVGWDSVLKNGDRIEIYRPLLLDPITRRSLKRELKKKQRR